MKILSSINNSIGSTPLVRLNKVVESLEAEIIAKLLILPVMMLNIRPILCK